MFVLAEDRGEVLDHLFESGHPALVHRLGQFVVRVETGLAVRLGEHLLVRHLSHEHLDYDGQFLHFGLEAQGASFGGLPKHLGESLETVGIVLLDALDQGGVVEVAQELGVLLGGREVGLVDEVLGQLHLVEGQVVAQQQVQQGGLADLVLMYTAVSVGLHQHPPTLLLSPLQLFHPAVEEVGAGRQTVQVP